MAESEKEKSVSQIIQALDVLSQTLAQARANRRASPRALSRSSSRRSRGDAASDEAVTPRALVRSASSKDRERAAVADDEASPRARVQRGWSPTSPLRVKPKLDKMENGGDAEDDYDSAHSEQLKSQGFPAVTPEIAAANGEKNARGPIRAPSQNGAVRRMGCLCSVEVVAAQGLPPSADGLRLTVTVRKKETRDSALQTMTARVQLGAPDFQEALYVRCRLYDTTDKAISVDPRPFLLSLVVDAPELDMSRSTVDLSLFAKEFTEKCRQGELFRQWDMVIPLAGKAKGGELVIKLTFQSIEDRSVPKVARTDELPKMDVPAPDLMGVGSFKLDGLEPEPTPTEEVKEMQHREPERSPADEHAPMAELKAEQQREEPDESTLVAEVNEEEKQKEREPPNEPIPVVEVKEEEQQKESECAPVDGGEYTLVTEVKEEEHQKELEPEQADEPAPVVEIKEELQKESEHEPTYDEHTLVDEMKEEGQQKELQREPFDDEHTPLAEVNEEERQKEPEHETDEEPTPLTEVKEEEQQKGEHEPVDEPTPVIEVKEEKEQKGPKSEPDDENTPVDEVEEEQQKEPQGEPVHDPTLGAEVKEEERQKSLENEQTDEPILVAEVNEEEDQRKEPEDAQEDDDLEVPEFDVIDKDVGEQEVEAELKEKADTEKELDDDEEVVPSTAAGDEVATAAANGLEQKSIDATTPGDMSVVVAEVAEPVDAEAALSEEATTESSQVPKQGGDKGASAKRSRPPLKWRTVALLVPVSVLLSKTLGAK